MTWAHSPARPPDLPIRPDAVYRQQGWANWSDWLGTTRPARSSPPWRPFPAARAYAQSLHLGSVWTWRAWSQTAARPRDVPSNPDTAYREAGWAGWGDWLGTGRRRVSAGQVLPFAQARTDARRLGLRSAREWYAWVKTAERPASLPTRPDVVYRDQGWAGWADWLGPRYGARRPCRFRPFAEARAYVHRLGLRSSTAWVRWAATAARPRDIPSNPARTYRNQGWAGFRDWLGQDRRRDQPLE
jgi:hypothetical protein